MIIIDESRYEQLLDTAMEYHEEHPEAWTDFVNKTRWLIDKGFRNYSARAVFHSMRWDHHMEHGPDSFKLNNNLTPFYARWFMEAYPEHKGFFRTREQISKVADASYSDELTPDGFK